MREALRLESTRNAILAAESQSKRVYFRPTALFTVQFEIRKEQLPNVLIQSDVDTLQASQITLNWRFLIKNIFSSCIVEATTASRFDHGCTSTPHSIPSAANVEHSASDVEASQEERLRFSFALDFRNKNGNIAGPLVFAYPFFIQKRFVHQCVV